MRHSSSNASASIPHLAVFLLLEAGFLALGLYCLHTPLSLPLLSNGTFSREAKALTTALAVVWHALAALAAGELIGSAFSAECIAQYRRTGTLKPGETDRVSTVAASFTSRMMHLTSRAATLRYRVAFVAAVALMALGPIGPSVLTMSSIPVQSFQRIQLSNLTLNHALQMDTFLSKNTSEERASERAKLFLNMETWENYTFNYQTVEERLLIPWPQRGLESLEESIRYSSDVVTYDYNCSWEAPSVTMPGGNDTMWTVDSLIDKSNITTVNGQKWTTRIGLTGFSEPSRRRFDMIMPLSTLTESGLSEKPTSAFLFLGGPPIPFNNSPIVSISGKLNLVNLPFVPFQPLNDTFVLRASVLLCEPRLEIFPAAVLLEQGALRLDKRGANKLPLVGNIPEHSANVIFSQGFTAAMEPSMRSTDLDKISSYAMTLFLDPFQSSITGPRTVLPLKKINENMNIRLQSATKAYLDGVVIEDATGRLSRKWTEQNGTRERRQLALASSRPFLIALIVDVGILAVLLSGLLIIMKRTDMQLFDLHNFTLKKNSSVPKSESSVYRSGHSNDQPTSHLDQVSLRSLRTMPLYSDNGMPYTLRLAIFLILEAGFLALGFHCLRTPITLSLLNDDMPINKAVITAITVIWHTLAALVVQDLTFRAFSAECMAQYCLTRVLKPGTTDRVSTLAAGFISRAMHALSRTATSLYRVGFAAAVVLMTLGPLGPAVLSISLTSTPALQVIQLSNLTLNHTFRFSAWRNTNMLEDRGSERAEQVLRMETFENSTFGYQVAGQQVLIPWPQAGLKLQKEKIRYFTDVVTYDIDCSWNIPVPIVEISVESILVGNITANGIKWVPLSDTDFYDVPEAKTLSESVETPSSLSPTTANDNSTGMIMPLTTDTSSEFRSQTPTLGFIFVGPTDLTSGGLDLTNLPSISFLFWEKSDLELRASVLLCEPHLELFSAEVLLEQGVLRLDGRANRTSLIGNIPEYSANVVFSQGLVAAMQPAPDSPEPERLSMHAISHFLDSSQSNTTGQRKVLPLEKINENLNIALQSAAKAYLGGVVVEDASGRLSRKWTAQNGTREQQHLALVANEPFLMTLITVVGILAVLLSSLIIIMQRNDMQLFDLYNFTLREDLKPVES